MKFVFLAGGFAGFVIAALAGLSAGRTADLLLRDAALGCVAGALLFRWFWSVLVRAMTETIAARQAAMRAAAAIPVTPEPVRTK